jgi:3D (Asp-Asp-Asp) domain-containing protein
MGIRITTALAAIAVSTCLWCRSDPLQGAEERGRPIGTFRITYYFVAEERETGTWPLFSSRCARVLARTSREFHHALSLEGTGRLMDGRLLNYAQDCPCARAGFAGRRICYEEVDQVRYPWGKGARFGEVHAPLEPFRSVAVDPALISAGSILFIPEWRSGTWPDGSRRDGCVRAEDSGSGVRGRHLDLFAGSLAWAEKLQSSAPARVRVFRDSPHCRHVRGR